MKNFLIIMVLFLVGCLPAYRGMVRSIRPMLGVRLAAVFLPATLAGFFVPAPLLFLLFLAVLVVVTITDRVGAACQFILLAGLIVQVSFALNVGGHFLGFLDQLATIGIAAAVVARAKGGPLPRAYRHITAEDALIVVTFLIMAEGGFGFTDLNTVLRAQISQGLLVLLPYFFMRYAVRTPEEYRRMIACFGFSAVLLAVFAIYEAHFGWSIFEGINYQLGSTALSKDMLNRGSHLRAPATMAGPLALGCYLTIALLAQACSRDYFRNGFAYWATMAVTAVGFLATQSRGSLVALVAGLVMLCVVWRRWGIVFLLGISAAVGTSLLFAAAKFSPTLAAFLNVDQPSHYGGYYDYRQLLFDAGVAQVKQHPLLGMRLQPVLDAMSGIQQGEHIVDLVNIYLVVLLISGIVGFIPFVLLSLKSLWNGLARYRRIRDLPLLRARAFAVASFTATLIQFSFMSFIDRIPLLFALSLVGIRIVSTARTAAVKARRKAAVPVTEPAPSLPPEALPAA